MLIGTQYYRAPFPRETYWEDDLRRMKDSGLDAVQLWVVWGWVEPKPGQFRFEDYDRLVELAEKAGLQVVLSTIAAIHPYWIHREIPDCEPVDADGHRIVSSNRVEVHNGLTPGGCFDHPEVWSRMAAFLEQTVSRYKDLPHLFGWDAWNEVRWNVQADRPVCYCPHTLAAFRRWLEDQHGSLDGLNAAWERRYADWEDVRPGKMHDHPYTEMMAFLHFLTERTNAHARARYDVMKGIDPGHPVTIHGAFPCPTWSGTPDNQTLNRGNDWDFADHLDGVGCSNFPKWSGIDDADFGLRIEMVRSAARDKQVWLSEIQGGRAANGAEVHLPVDASSQQRWIWNGLACGADALLFWCWRDEVFGRESGGFGLTGADGLAEERLDAMVATAKLMTEHAGIFQGYAPAKPRVGVYFSPQSYYLHWSREGTANKPVEGLMGYTRALVRKSIAFTVVEENHLDALKDLRVLFMPRSAVIDAPQEAALEAFVRGGGTILCESECGAFGRNGLYRYPEERFITRLSGLREIGRRTLPHDYLLAAVDGEDVELSAVQWVTPLTAAAGETICSHPEGALIQRVPVGEGAVVYCGAYLGDAYRQHWTEGFESLLEHIARDAGWEPTVRVVNPTPAKDTFVYLKEGSSGGKPVLFIFAPEGTGAITLAFREGYFGNGRARDLVSGSTIDVVTRRDHQACIVHPARWNLAVLTED